MKNNQRNTRIILVNGSPILHEMICKAITKQENLQVVAKLHDIDQSPEAIEDVNADWIYLLLPTGKKIPPVIEKVMNENNEMRLLVMSSDGSSVRVKWVEQHDHVLKIDELKQIFEILEKKDLLIEDNHLEGSFVEC
jgi:chemotaxis response regulator CheB